MAKFIVNLKIIEDFCQTLGLVLRLRVDFVLFLSQEEEQQEKEPPPKSIKRGSARRLKFAT